MLPKKGVQLTRFMLKQVSTVLKLKYWIKVGGGIANVLQMLNYFESILSNYKLISSSFILAMIHWITLTLLR